MKHLICLIVFILSGCANVKIVEQSKIEESTGTMPQLHTITTAPVGDVLFSQYRYWRKTGWTVSGSASVSIGGGKVVVSAGDFLFRAVVDGAEALCTEKRTFQVLIGSGKTSCFSDRNRDGLLDQVRVASEVAWWSADVSPAIGYQTAEVIIPRPETIKRELVYQGYSKGVLKLSYREYVNDLARPAFFQEVTYDIEAFPTEVTFKTSRLLILKAGNSGIEYKVLSSF